MSRFMDVLTKLNESNTLKHGLVDKDMKPVDVGSHVEIYHYHMHSSPYAMKLVTGIVTRIDPHAITLKLDEDTKKFTTGVSYGKTMEFSGGDLYTITSPWEFDHKNNVNVGRKDLSYSTEVNNTYIKNIG